MTIISTYRAALAALPVGTRRRLLYAKAHRRAGRLARPRRFTEKVNCGSCTTAAPSWRGPATSSR
jgi:hypothetical protein